MAKRIYATLLMPASAASSIKILSCSRRSKTQQICFACKRLSRPAQDAPAYAHGSASAALTKALQIFIHDAQIYAQNLFARVTARFFPFFADTPPSLCCLRGRRVATRRQNG